MREEDRLPSEKLREDAADRGAEGRPEHAGGDPDAQRTLLALELREEVERRRDHQGRPDRLHAARADEHLERRCEPAHERRRREHDAPDHERLAGPSPSDVRGRHGEHRKYEVERGEHPGDRRDRHVELAEDLGEREGDDRGVGERETHGHTEQSRAHGTSVGAVGYRPAMRRAAVAIFVAAGFAVVGTASALVPGDPNGSHPAYATLEMPAAWELTTGSPDVIIAIVDSGVDASHPDLAGAVLPGFDFVTNAPAATPVDGHGTGVAGAAAARGNNGIGGAGTCFRCSILPLRVIGNDGIAFNTTTARAIDYAVDHGAAVVNASIYGPTISEPLRRSIRRARAAGVLVVAAAGNEGDDTPQYPAAFPETISVGASTYAGARASFSSYGSWVGFAAPECAPISVLGGTSGVGCMTSVSSPLVAGIIGLLRTQAPFASVDQIEAALIASARARPVAGVRAGLVDAAGRCARSGRRSLDCGRSSWATPSQGASWRFSPESGRARSS